MPLALSTISAWGAGNGVTEPFRAKLSSVASSFHLTLLMFRPKSTFGSFIGPDSAISPTTVPLKSGTLFTSSGKSIATSISHCLSSLPTTLIALTPCDRRSPEVSTLGSPEAVLSDAESWPLMLSGYSLKMPSISKVGSSTCQPPTSVKLPDVLRLPLISPSASGHCNPGWICCKPMSACQFTSSFQLALTAPVTCPPNVAISRRFKSICSVLPAPSTSRLISGISLPLALASRFSWKPSNEPLVFNCLMATW